MHATKLNVDRDVYEVDYSDQAGDVDGDTVEAVFTNPDNGDKSVYAGSNDGKFIVTVATGHVGSDDVTITGSDGGEISGSVSFGG